VATKSSGPHSFGVFLPLNFSNTFPLRILFFAISAFWLERLPQLLDLPVTLEVLLVATVVSPAATAEPDFAI
jgi:hypothetical protein